MWSYGLGICNANQNARIRHLSGEAPVAAHHATDSRSRLLGALQRTHQIGADVPLRVPSSNREDQNEVPHVDVATAQPIGVGRFPAVVVDACGEFGDVVAGSVGFYAANFAKVANCVGSMAGT